MAQRGKKAATGKPTQHVIGTPQHRHSDDDEEWNAELTKTKRDKFDFDNDGVVTNDEYIAGVESELNVSKESGAIDINVTVEGDEWDEDEDAWSTKKVFLGMEEDLQRRVLPDAMPTFLHQISLWAVSPLEGGVLAFVIAVCGALDYALMTWANARLEVRDGRANPSPNPDDVGQCAPRGKGW